MATPVSYTTTIKASSLALRYYPTAPFCINSRTYCGVIVPTDGIGTEFAVDQKVPTVGAAFHNIRISETQWLTYVSGFTYSELPVDVQARVPSTATAILTTSRYANKIYMVTTTASSATASTVDLASTVSGVFFGFGNNFWRRVGNSMAVGINTGSPMTLLLPSDSNTSGGSSGTVDPEGNPTLERGDCVSFTATTKGPMLGAYNTGVLVPSYSRPGSFPVTTAATPGETRYLPVGSAFGPELSQPTLQAPQPFTAGTSVATIGPVGSLGGDVAISSNGEIIAAANSTTNGDVRIYRLAIGTPPLLQTLTVATGNSVGPRIQMSDDGTVVAFLEAEPGGEVVYVRIYVRSAPNTDTWVEAATSGVNIGEVGQASNRISLSMSSDGRIIAATNSHGGGASNTVVLEDTSCDGSWATLANTDIAALMSGTDAHVVTLSPEGQWLYLATDAATPIEGFYRNTCDDWSTMGFTIIPGLGEAIYDMTVSYDGVYLAVLTDGGGGILRNYARFGGSNLVLAGVNILALGSSARVATNTAGSTVMVVDGLSDSVSGQARMGSGPSRLITESIAFATTLSSVAFTDNNIIGILVIGEPSTGTVYIQSAQSNALSFLTAQELVIGTAADGSDDQLRINLDGTHLLNDLYLEGKTNDPAFAVNTASNTTITLRGSATAGTFTGIGTTTNISIQRTNNMVMVVVNLDYTSLTGATGFLQMDISGSGLTMPSPDNDVISSPGAIVVMGSLVNTVNGPFTMTTTGPPNGVNVIVRWISSTILEFFENRTDGTTVPINADAATVPHVNSGATASIQFTLMYFTKTT